MLETPFDERGRVDFDSLHRLIEDVIQGGIHGLMAPLVASEVHSLTVDERIQIVSTAVATIRHRVPFVVGASSNLAEECRAFAALAAEIGADAYLVAVPGGFYGDPDRILDFFRTVVSASGAPLIIQDLQWNGPGLDMATIQTLKDSLPTLAGMKIETVPAGPKYTAVRQAMGRGFYLSGGWAIPQLIEALDRGVDAMVPESALVRVFVAVYQAYAKGLREEAVRVFRELLPVLVFSNQEINTSIAFFKRMLVRKGILTSPTMRSPGFQWDSFNARIADELIEYYLDLEGQLAGGAG